MTRPHVTTSPPPWPRGLLLFAAAKLAAVVLGVLGQPVAALVVFLAPDPWFCWQFARPSARGFGPLVTRFNTPRREVWLTLDDGPDPATTPRILDLLDAHAARATFFVIGEKAARHPHLVAAIVRRGHTVGNHTHTHPVRSFWCAFPARLAAEIDRCDHALVQAGATASPWFRPPAGVKNPLLHRLLPARGKRLVLWSARAYDTRPRPPAAALQDLRHGLAPGAILLLHENTRPGATSFELLGALLQELDREGYACVLPPTESLAGPA